MFGFYRIATCTTPVKVADVSANVQQIKEYCENAHKRHAAIALFPELALTSAACGDLFRSSALIEIAQQAVQYLVSALPQDIIAVFGAPVLVDGRLYNAAIVCQNRRILAVIPKLTAAAPFARPDTSLQQLISFAGFTEIPFGNGIVIAADPLMKIGTVFAADAFGAISPAAALALGGANTLLYLDATPDFIGQAEFKAQSVTMDSARLNAAVAIVSAGSSESTTDTVCSGLQAVAENGTLLLKPNTAILRESISFTDVDLQRINAARLADEAFQNTAPQQTIRVIYASPAPIPEDCIRSFSKHPFIPDDQDELESRCETIMNIQTAALAQRILHTHSKKLVLGISGGLDSTLALLVCHNTLHALGRPEDDLIAITMPGFGTTDRTYSNAVGLCRSLHADLREISIKNACLQHFEDISHNPSQHDVVYENSQARERTQILLDIANQEGGLAIGTGDLSEAAMGWCTFNGDHISMYSVNCSVPKTIIRHIITWFSKRLGKDTAAILQDIIDTPISPELLPASQSGQINQKTEDIIGPYEIHDFFLYHFVKYGADPQKLLFMASQAFKDDFTEEALKRFLDKFLGRFFSQQFKRNCVPDGPKVGSICLSPRGAWTMPSDASPAIWLNA